MEKQVINIPPIVLEWSDWTPWDNLKIDARHGGGVKVPSGVSGVYEAKYRDSEERLHIGETDNLRQRVKDGLVKGTIPHKAGIEIRDRKEVSKIVVRWAITDRRFVAQAALHEWHKERFGKFPKHTKRT